MMNVQRVQCTLDGAAQFCMLAEDPGALYVCFRGTRLSDAADVLANTRRGAVNIPTIARVHEGYWDRASTVRVMELVERATNSNRRLVFCGHSLGGAVACLATLRTITEARITSSDDLACYTFGQPQWMVTNAVEQFRARASITLENVCVGVYSFSVLYPHSCTIDFLHLCTGR